VVARECAAQGIDIGLSTAGIAHVALDDESAAALHAQVDAQRAMGLEASWLDAGELRRRHPGVGPAARGALLAPRDGAVNNVALTAALLARAFALGVTLVQDEACEITARRGRVAGVNGATTSYAAEIVVLAAGAWSG